MDFGKYKYEKSKKAGGHSHQTKTKEIRLRPKRVIMILTPRFVRRLLPAPQRQSPSHGRLSRSRDAHIDEGRRVMESVIKTLSEYGKLEQPPQQQGKRMLPFFGPKYSRHFPSYKQIHEGSKLLVLTPFLFCSVAVGQRLSKEWFTKE